jgi:acetyl-CoA synthetase
LKFPDWCLQVTLAYTAPTAIRALQSFGNDWVTKYSRASLRILGTVGEPINPEAWKWYHEVCALSLLPYLTTAWRSFPQGLTADEQLLCALEHVV